MPRVSGGAILAAGTATSDVPLAKKSSRPSAGPSSAGLMTTAAHTNSWMLTKVGAVHGMRTPAAVRLTATMLTPTYGALTLTLPRHGTGSAGDVTERVLGSSDALKTRSRGSGGDGASVSTAGSPRQ